jgi:hypothetical protein
MCQTRGGIAVPFRAPRARITNTPNLEGRISRTVAWLAAAALAAVAYAAPEYVWTYRYGPVVGGKYQPLASFVDDTGNVSVVGWQEVDTNGLDVFVFKVDSLGQLLWHKTYDNMTAVGAARDASGNVYISGAVNGSSTRSDICVLKYKPNGDRDWVKTYGESGKDFLALRSIAMDDSGSVYACGVAESSSCFAVRVLRYWPGSTRVDTIRYALLGYGQLCDGEFHVTRGGEVYLALSVEHPTRWQDCLAVKLSRQGVIEWEKLYKSSDSTWEQPRWSQVDGSGSIYITGISARRTSQAQSSFFTLKIDSLGDTAWSREYNGPENLRDDASFLLLDRGNVYVAGSSMYKEAGEDLAIALVKYDSLGNELWASRYGGADTNAELGYEYTTDDWPGFCSMKVDQSGNAYLAGSSWHFDTGVLGILLQYTPQGDLLQVRKLGTPGERWFCAIADTDYAGAFYAVGQVRGGGRTDVFVVKYRGM